MLARMDALSAQMDRIAATEQAQRDAQTAALSAAINQPGWFRAVFGNKYVQMALVGLSTWLGTKGAQ